MMKASMFDGIRNRSQMVIGFLVLFYTVGVLLFILDFTRPLFRILTPFSLVFSFAIVLVFQTEWTWRYILGFLLVFSGTILIEIIGVQTGLLFGHYVYGSALGIKIFDTPVLIGINWLLLIYCTAAIVQHHLRHKMAMVVVASLMMVGYDLVLEYVAPVSDMWSWDTRYPGVRNFLMWFLVSLVFHTVFQLLKLRIENKPARYLFWFQFLFLSAIAIYTFIAL
jgi:putative membrane protein